MVDVLLADVHFPDPPHGCFTYRVPNDLSIDEVGVRVRVPFGRKRRIGFVTRLYFRTDQSDLKEIIEPIDLVPLLSPALMELTRWMAEYYLCDWGETIAAATPTGLKPHRSVRYRLTETAWEDPLIAEEISPTADLWRALRQKPLSLQYIRRHFPDGERLFRRFKQREWLETAEFEPRKSVQRYDIVWRWTNDISYEEALEKLPKNARRLSKAVQLLDDAKGSLTQRNLATIAKGFAPVMRSLVKKGWVVSERIVLDRLSLAQQGLEETASTPPVLTPTQEIIVRRIHQALGQHKYQTFLLHGVTGSGKTLIYLEAIASALQEDKGVIVMTPEISLTPQLTGRIYRRFGDKVVVTHSGLSAGERQDVWRMIRSGRARIVVGPRSTLFSPIDRLGLIIVDEEHDDSYKQSDPAPRYNGRDAAIFRATRCDAVVLLGSATPSVTSYHNALSGRWELLELPERYGGIKLPDVWVVKWGIGGEGTIFGPDLRSRIAKRLERCEQVILLINRRGFASYIRCPDCGDVANCPNCDITLRYHRVGQKLECHYCGYSKKTFDLCPKCRGQRLRYNGIGTQRVERELERLFPKARVLRMDWDTTRRRGGHQDILARFARREYDILLGTQMVAKGHDFPGVTLVGILAADFEWIYPDYRSIERAFRLMVQASGRTGRSGRGEVVIQTWTPTHPMLRWVQKHDYRSLYDSESGSRELLKYPPFGRFVTVLVRGADRNSVISAANVLKDKLTSELRGATILGPAKPFIERMDGQFRRRLLLKFPVKIGLAVREDKLCLKDTVNQLAKKFQRADMKFIIDVDPVET